MTSHQRTQPMTASAGNPEAIWKLVMAMKLNGLPKEALKPGFLADFEIKQFQDFWSLGYAELCKWSRRHD